MKKLVVVLLLAQLIGCAVPGILPLQPNLNFNVTVPPLPAALVPLDGQWVLSGVDGVRSCLVIQESRVAILDLTCSSDGRGFAARIIDQPIITRAGQVIVLSVSYNPLIFDTSQARLTFTGTLQVDGGFIGSRRDELSRTSLEQPDEIKVTTSVTPAVFARI